MENDKHKLPDMHELLCFNFYRGWRRISEFYRHYLPEGVSAQQSYILELCEEKRGIKVSEIADKLEIDMSAISSMLRRMEASQLIHREVVLSNRRKIDVFLTPTGKKLRDSIRKLMVEPDRLLNEAICPEAREQLIHIVDKLHVLLSTNQNKLSP